MELTIHDIGILSSYTRRKLLKILSAKRMALPDISNITGMSKSALHEHLSKLAQTGFVEREGQGGRKPVYYSATEKGARLMQNEARVIVMADIALASFIAGFLFIYNYMVSFGKITSMKSAQMLTAVEESAMQAFPENAGVAVVMAEPTSKSSLWLFAGLLLIVIAGLVVYAMFRKHDKGNSGKNVL